MASNDISTPSVAHTGDKAPLAAEAASSPERKMPETSPEHQRIAIQRKSTHIFVFLNAYVVILSLTWYLSHYDEPGSVITVSMPLLASVLSILNFRHRNHTVPDRTIEPTTRSYDSVGSYFALLTFCRIMMSGYVEPPFLFENKNPTIWLFSSVCLAAKYVVPISYTRFSRWGKIPTATISTPISSIKWYAGILHTLPLLYFPLPASLPTLPRNAQDLFIFPETIDILITLFHGAVFSISFGLYCRIKGYFFGSITVKSLLISDLKYLAVSLVIGQLIRSNLSKDSSIRQVIEFFADSNIGCSVFDVYMSATNFLISHIYYQISRSGGRIKRVLLSIVVVTAVACTLVNNPYLAPAGCPTRHVASHACYSQIPLNDPMSLQKQAFCYDNYKTGKGPQEIEQYLSEKREMIASSCSEDQLTSIWSNSCTDLQSRFALHRYSGIGVTASPQRVFLIAPRCLEIYRPKEARRIPILLRQDEMIGFFHHLYFPQYPESERLISKSPLYLARGPHFVYSRWKDGS